MRKWLEKNDIYNYPCLTLNKNNEGAFGGIPLAYDENKVYVAGDEGHSLIIGSTGSKKSRLIVMPAVVSMIKASENIIVSDPKGEIYNATHNLAKKEGYEIVKLNFRDLGTSNCWNPLEKIKTAFLNGDLDKVIQNVMNMTETLIVIKTSKDPYWELAGKEFTAMILYATILSGKINFKSFIKKFDLISKLILDTVMSEDEKEYVKLMKEKDRLYKKLNLKNKKLKRIRQDVYNLFSVNFDRLGRLPKNTISCIIGVVSSCLHIFSTSSTFLDKTSYSDFKYLDIVNKKLILYLIIPEENISFEILIKLFVEESYSYIINYLHAHHNGKAPSRINYVLDEFANIPVLNNFQKNISISRSRNIRYTLIIQNIGQLNAQYGEKNAQTIVGNCDNIVYLYSNDDYTNRYIHSKVKDHISENGIKSMSKERGEALFLLGRSGEYIGRLEDIDRVLEMI